MLTAGLIPLARTHRMFCVRSLPSPVTGTGALLPPPGVGWWFRLRRISHSRPSAYALLPQPALSPRWLSTGPPDCAAAAFLPCMVACIPDPISASTTTTLHRFTRRLTRVQIIPVALRHLPHLPHLSYGDAITMTITCADRGT